MAIELAAGYVSLSVKMDGATKGLGKLFDGAQKQALGAGKKTGEAYTKGLEAELKTAQAQVQKLSEAMVKARDKEADAAGKLRVATEKLNEARGKGVTGSSLTRLEEQRETLLRRQTAAAKALSRETDGLAQAEKRRVKAQTTLDGNQPKKGLFSRVFSGAGDSAESAGANAGSRFSAGFSKVMKAAGALAIGGGIAGAMTGVVRTGLDFERTMNTLTGVTGASDAVMQKFRDTAKALGNDVSLSNTSAADAALAMTELAKAGFSVDQSMAGAKGTLQLAAAAQVDAAQAAEIQANALQAFGLNADYAGKAADILANAANASSAEIVDVAQALQQGGAVASSFGLSIEDTSAAIALLANNGIKGSDAGTLLKSALLSLTDQSNPAQGAIETLGLTLYDAQGQFVGLSQMFAELEVASKRLTPEQYQAATATLFGSDAMRLAAVAAKDGRQGIDDMTVAIEKQGSAADLAAAQNKGLPGVIERIKNAAETLAISVFEKIQGPLSNVGDGLTGFIDRMGEAFENPAVGEAASSLGSAFSGIGSAIGSVANAIGPAFVDGLSGAVNLFFRLKGVIVPLAAGFVAYKVAVFAATIPLKAAAAAQLALNAAMALNPVGLVVAAIAALVAGLVWFFTKTEAGKKAWAGFTGFLSTAWESVKLAFSAAWTVLSGIFSAIITRVGEVWEGVKSRFTAVVDFVKGLPGKISTAAKGMWDGIGNAFKSTVNGMIRVWNNFASKLSFTTPDWIPGIGGKTFSLPTIPEFARGGIARGMVRGPGTGTSDSVLAWLSDGEGVVTAKAMSSGGAGVVEALNQGWVPSSAYLRDMFDAPGYAKGLGPGASYLRSLVMKLWPSITTVGGVRGEDGLGEHSSGNALDIMIPDYQSPQGQAMGDAISAFIRKNASALQLDGLIWKQQSFGYGGSLTAGKQMSDRGSDTQNHMDHLHVMLGKGRGAGASPVSMPSVKLSSPSGTGGGSLGGGGRGKGMSEAQRAQKAADKQTRIDQLNAELAAAEQSLAEAEANGKTKESTLMSKRNAVQKKKDAITKAERELEEIENSPLADDLSSTSGASTSDNPFAKIIDGFSQLGQAGMDGAVEGLLPPGFSNPMEWGVMKAGGGLMKWIGGLTGDPVANAILGSIGSGMTGDVQGAGSALAGLFNPQEMLAGVAGDDMGGAFTDGMIDPAMAMAGGAPVDNSIHIDNAPYQDSTQKVMDTARGQQMSQQRRHMGTKRF